MSFLAMEWARLAPVNYAGERAILYELAYRAWSDGTDAYPSRTTLARIACCSVKSVSRYLAGLLDLGLIALGNQDSAARIPVGQRPVVYDLMIPYDWFSEDQRAAVNAEREQRGLPPLTAADRPKLKPVRRTRAKTKPKVNNTMEGEPAGQDQGHFDPGPGGGTNCPREGGQNDPQQSPTPTGTKSSKDSSSGAAAPDADPPRDDVEQLCTRLADLIEGNGNKRPTITKAWRDAARLMLDRDQRPLDKALALVEWCQGNNFWRRNVMSMPKFREQYDRLRMTALDEWNAAHGKPGSNVRPIAGGTAHNPHGTPLTDADYQAGWPEAR